MCHLVIHTNVLNQDYYGFIKCNLLAELANSLLLCKLKKTVMPEKAKCESQTTTILVIKPLYMLCHRSLNLDQTATTPVVSDINVWKCSQQF